MDFSGEEVRALKSAREYSLFLYKRMAEGHLDILYPTATWRRLFTPFFGDHCQDQAVPFLHPWERKYFLLFGLRYLLSH